jgi:hypothetical protein|tara:strand:- start:111 stop:374 length:264 start_codon:yes stop_codon:yes gene_type:complete
METNSESPIIIQMFKNIKKIIAVSKERECWSLEELKEIDITYHNVSEIARQLQEKYKESVESIEDPVLSEPVLDELDELDESMDEVD